MNQIVGNYSRVNMILLIALATLLTLVYSNNTTKFLAQFGYIDENALTNDISEGLTAFQEAFHLNVSGTLDSKTLEFMTRPRCGNKDVLLPFTAVPNRKWNSSVITWYQYGTPQHPSIIEKAFNVWSKHANIVFKKDFSNPTIIISFSGQRRHVLYSRHDTCYYNFDGPGSVLAHAYLPTSAYNQTDIHLDSEENWDFTLNLPGSQNTSFFLTLVHEIGHALGLDHSFDNKSVMYPYMDNPVGITDLNEFSLSKDDVLAIQYLYGRPPIKPSTTSTTTLPTTTTSSTTSTTTTTVAPPEAVEEVNICDFKDRIKTYVIVNKKIFAFFKNYVWVISLDPVHRTPEEYTRPKILTEWLRFLPANFTEISAIYQRPNGNIALFSDREVYMFKYPTLSFIAKYSVSSIAGKPVKHVNTVFNSNQGKTYMLIDDWYIVTINECTYAGTFLGITSSTLYGVPSRVQGGFRYINGRIYFITDSSVLEFNEFTNVITGSKSTTFEILQITCLRESLIHRLYEVLKYLE